MEEEFRSAKEEAERTQNPQRFDWGGVECTVYPDGSVDAFTEEGIIEGVFPK